MTSPDDSISNDSRRQDPINASPCRHSVSKSEARRDEADDLLVVSLIIAVDEIDRVAPSCRLHVASSEQSVEAFLDAVHFAEVLAILPSQPQ